ncbi:MAG: hypothetical protein ACE5IR_18665, partial [bacterium]
MAEQSKHLYLPQLQLETANIAIPESSGLWKNNDHKIILGISDAIMVDDSALTRGISSIPDIWARPLMFQSGLNPKSNHPLHKRITQEWRGLLSLLALCKIKSYPIEIVTVTLENDPFSHSLQRLAPGPVQLQEGIEYPWTDAFLIYYNKIVVGAFSPATLVYTGSDYNYKLKNESLMLRDADGYLCEPDKMYKDELRYVGEWLQNLQSRLNPKSSDQDNKGARMYTDTENPHRHVVEMINELIAIWLDEICEALGLGLEAEIESNAEIATEPVTPAEGARHLEKYKIYQALLYPLVQDEDAVSTDMGLDFLRETSGYKKVIVVTEKTLRDHGQIWGTTLLRDLGGDAARCIEQFFKAPFGDSIGGASLSTFNAIWIRPEKYFLSDVLLRGKQGYVLTEDEAEFNCGRRYVMPFTPEILRFFTPEEIVDRLKPALKEENQMVRFGFSLPIIDRNGAKTTIQIEKIFRMRPASADDGTIIDTEAPVLEIFPKYLGPRWRRHYVFNSHADNFEVTPVVNGKAEINSCLHDTTIDGARSKIGITQIIGDDAFPEGLAISRAGDNQEQIGLVLLKRESLLGHLEGKWKIGVDFGTSNTNVFKLVGEKAQPWIFDFPRYTHRVFLSDEEQRRQLMRDFFIPSEKISLPIPTILKIYNSNKKDNLLFDYFIYFTDGYKLLDHARTNIKWEEEEKDTKFFIRSILFLLLIELADRNVKSADLGYSYPKAFSEDDCNTLKQEWNYAFKELLEREQRVMDCSRPKLKQLLSGTVPEILDPFFETEGYCSGQYFNSYLDLTDQAGLANAAICLDVGGGTTDISIWYDTDIVSDASVLFAGQEISQSLRSESSRVREYLFSPNALISLEEKLDEDMKFVQILNLVLCNEEKQIHEKLLDHSNKQDILWLRQMLALGFSALSYFTALLTIATDSFLRKSLSLDSEDTLLK